MLFFYLQTKITFFSDPEREFKVTQSFDGFFEHASDNGEKEYRPKKAYVLEKV